MERPGDRDDVLVRKRSPDWLGGQEGRAEIPCAQGDERGAARVQAAQEETLRIYTRWSRGRRKAPNWKIVEKEIKDTLDKTVKPELVAEFKKIVAGWEHKIQFRARKFIRRDYVAVNVFPTGPNKRIWSFVSGGTKPHDIVPKKAKALSFIWAGPGSYVPKTAPGVYGGPGIVTGGKPVAFKSVHHPGTKPRNFEHYITERYRPRFQKHMENAFRRGLRRAHAAA